MLCQHSHCIGCYEEYQGGHILYGQGNFHFAKPGFVDPKVETLWSSSLAVKYDTTRHSIEFIPVVVLANGGIGLAQGQEKARILEAFEKRNQTLSDGSWKEGWHAFCESMKDRYLKAIADACVEGATARQNAVFGHYLDCDAHTDVWRELFPTANQFNEKE